MGLGNLGSSESTTRYTDDNSQLAANDQATVLQLKGAGSKTVGSTVKSGNTTVKIGKGATYTVTNTGLDEQTLAQVLSQANLKTSERSVSPTTGLATPDAPESPLAQFAQNKLLIGLGFVALGFVIWLARRH